MLDVRIFHNAKFGALANRQKLGWIYLLCEAKQQDREGVFPSRPGLLLGAGPFRDCIPAWLEGGLLHNGEALCDKCAKSLGPVPINAVVVHDWSDYQPSRTTQWRDANGVSSGHESLRGNNGETLGETHLKPLRARTRASVSASSSSSTTEEGSGEEPRDPVVAYANLTGTFPSPRAMDWLDDLTGQYGADAVLRALGKARGPAGKLIGAAQDILRSEARELSLREKEAERAKVADRRLDGMLKRRMEYFEQTGKWPADWGPAPGAAA